MEVMMRYWSVLLLAIAVAVSACQPAPAGEGVSPSGYYEMDVQQLHAELQDKDFVFVNVHIPFEGDIAGTDVSIPFDEITQPENLALLPADKDAKIVLYCRSGRMSAIAAKEMAALGYTNIWDVPGGFVEWEAAGYELEK
jgi:rhodanese-related sulfurtransferase